MLILSFYIYINGIVVVHPVVLLDTLVSLMISHKKINNLLFII